MQSDDAITVTIKRKPVPGGSDHVANSTDQSTDYIDLRLPRSEWRPEHVREVAVKMAAFLNRPQGTPGLSWHAEESGAPLGGWTLHVKFEDGEVDTEVLYLEEAQVALAPREWKQL